jgi:hypothetical protein
MSQRNLYEGRPTKTSLPGRYKFIMPSKRMMDYWAQNPVWQNYSSLMRESKTADKAKTGMERSHHTIASLYFGISALEAFVNSKMREKMEQSKKSEEEIVKKLKAGKIVEKLRKWPMEILGKDLTLSKSVLNVISSYNAVRGEVTHVKKDGQLLYRQLDQIDPITLSDSVAEYIVRFHEAGAVLILIGYLDGTT